MNSMHYRGRTWDYLFVNPDGCLKEEDRETLIKGTIDIYRDNKRRLSVKGKDFEGELRNTREDVVWSGGIIGRRIIGQLDTKKGGVNVEMLVVTEHEVSWN